MSTLALRLTGLCRAGMARCIFKAVTTELIPTLQLFLYLAGKWDPTFMAQWRSACAEVNGLASADGDDDAEGKRLFSIHFAASTDVDQIGTMNERFDTFGDTPFAPAVRGALEAQYPSPTDIQAQAWPVAQAVAQLGGMEVARA